MGGSEGESIEMHTLTRHCTGHQILPTTLYPTLMNITHHLCVWVLYYHYNIAPFNMRYYDEIDTVWIYTCPTHKQFTACTYTLYRKLVALHILTHDCPLAIRTIHASHMDMYPSTIMYSVHVIDRNTCTLIIASSHPHTP